jgi:hypothetical protein
MLWYMRYLLALVFLVGCGDVSALMVDGAAGSGGGAGGQGGTNVPASDGGDAMVTTTCNAPQASLNGRATYVSGSIAAVDPSADAGPPYGTCADWVRNFVAQGHESAIAAQATVVDGVIGGVATTLVRSTETALGCVYVLRRVSGPSGAALPCAVTLDYQLAQP